MPSGGGAVEALVGVEAKLGPNGELFSSSIARELQVRHPLVQREHSAAWYRLVPWSRLSDREEVVRLGRILSKKRRTPLFLVDG